MFHWMVKGGRAPRGSWRLEELGEGRERAGTVNKRMVMKRVEEESMISCFECEIANETKRESEIKDDT